jgi:hypothetical protein
MLTGYPPLPLYREILKRELEASSKVAGRHAEIASKTLNQMLTVTLDERDPGRKGRWIPLDLTSELPPSLDYFSDELSFGRILAPYYWLTTNIDSGLESELLRAQRSGLRRLGIYADEVPYPLNLTAVTTVYERMLKTATLHGLAENRIREIPLKIQQELLNYLGIPINLEKFNGNTLDLFITTVYFVIHQDPAYSTNFFMALNILWNNLSIPYVKVVDRHPSTAIIKAK